MKNSKFKFSVIIPVYKVEEYLEETLESVINQTIGFEENIQIILINDGSPDNSDKICEKYKEKFPNNIIYHYQENAGVSVARNKGIELAEGDFTTFLDSDDTWTEDSFEEVYHHIKNNPEINIFSCKMNFFDARKGSHNLNYKYKQDKIVNILEDFAYPQLSSSSLFIKTNVVKKYKYDKTIKYSEDNKFINEIIFDEEKFMVLKNPTYMYRKRQTGTSAIQGQEMKIDWYTITPEKVYKHLYDLSKKKFGRVIEYIQYLVVYEISWRIVMNKKFDISEKDRKKYEKILTHLIKNTDRKIIMEHPHLDPAKKLFLLEVRGEKQPEKLITYDDNFAYLDEYTMSKKTLGYLIIDQIYIRQGKFELYGKLDRRFMSQKDFKVKTKAKEIKVNYYDLTIDYNEETFAKINLHDYIGINIVLDTDEDWALSFYLKDTKIMPRFKKSSIFTEYLPNSYHHYRKRTFMFENYTLYNHKRNLLKSTIYELKNEIKLFRQKKYKVLFARINTKIARLFKRKELWLISDRVDKADDNGEHFFKYMVENHPEKNIYFVLTKNSVDYERLSKIGKVIDPNSNKYKLMFHRCDYVVSSHAENYIFNPLGQNGKYIQDQYQFRYVFLQHGIIKDDLSPWLNVNTKKMDMFVTSTNDEYNSLLECKYYFGPKVAKLTGLPRYDTLLKKQKEYKENKTIMMSLTWRNSLASVIDKETGTRVYNEDFKNSDYFKFIANVMTDEKLQKVLKEKKYKIRFIPHPNVMCQLKDFPVNEYVEIEKNGINYQKEFCENKLLITDYSSVFFDFGYLNKPIIYYQADRKEFFEGQLYDEGYFEYEKMGFGPICEDYDKFISELIKLIKNDCRIDEKYEKRIANTFKFRDNKNCERVYNAIINLDKRD